MAALGGGLLAGGSAVHGLRQKSYGPIDPPTLVTRDGRQPHDDGAPTVEAIGCEHCSERDLGYRWAMLEAVRSPDQCPDDSWGFRRGCLDYTGGT
jgi:hypothetical protein